MREEEEDIDLSRFLGHVTWIGLAGGAGSGLFGVGGGVILVPLLVRFLGLTQQSAHGTSLAVALCTAPAALIAYARGGHVDVTWALTLSLGSVIGAPAGAYWAHGTPAPVLRRTFGVLLIVLGIRLFLHHLPEGNILPTTGWEALFSHVLIGLVIGVLSGFLGVGGGVVMVPTLVLFAGLAQVEAQGISLLFVIPTAAAGTYTHKKLGNVDMHYAVPLALWSIVGAIATAFVATALPGRTLRFGFAVFLLLTGLKLALTKPSRRPNA